MHVCDAALGVVCGYLEDWELSRFSRCSRNLQTTIPRVSVLTRFYRYNPITDSTTMWKIPNIITHPMYFDKLDDNIENLLLGHSIWDDNYTLDTDKFKNLISLRIFAAGSILSVYKNSAKSSLRYVYINAFCNTFTPVFVSVESFECDCNYNCRLDLAFPNLKRLMLRDTFCAVPVTYPTGLDYANVYIDYRKPLAIPNATILHLHCRGSSSSSAIGTIDLSGHDRVRDIVIESAMFSSFRYNKQLRTLHVLHSRRVTGAIQNLKIRLKTVIDYKSHDVQLYDIMYIFTPA